MTCSYPIDNNVVLLHKGTKGKPHVQSFPERSFDFKLLTLLNTAQRMGYELALNSSRPRQLRILQTRQRDPGHLLVRADDS